MSESTKNKIAENLQESKKEGQLRAARIKEIVKEAIVQSIAELKEGSGEIRSLAKDAIAATIETFQEKGEDIKEEITASIEGVVEGISSAKQKAISEKQTEIKQLEGTIEVEQAQLHQEIEETLTDIQTDSVNHSEPIKVVIKSAIDNISNSEEAELLQKRYAQLKAQLAVVQANLASRYGERYEDVQKYLDEAKTWYDKAKEDPEIFTEPVKQKRVEFEKKLGTAGKAIAEKEHTIKKLLKELWQEVVDVFHNK